MIAQSFVEAFLIELDEHRGTLARAFKSRNHDLDGESLTETTQLTLDRLVFMRFLEDKRIEPTRLVATFGEQGTAWHDFVAASRRLDKTYNGIVFEAHHLLDAPAFEVDDSAFASVCSQLSRQSSSHDFDSFPIHLLGSIHERSLGDVIVAAAKRVRVEPKPEVRKAGGVYYTPEFVARFIVESTVGKIIEGKTPDQISELRFADIACGSGSILLAIYDVLLQHHAQFYNGNPASARKADFVVKDEILHLSLKKKRDILLSNIYGVDIDPQAVAVARRSLYLKLLEGETTASAGLDQPTLHEALLPSLDKNIICGNSLVGGDTDLQGQFLGTAMEDCIDSLDWQHQFKDIMRGGGFDAVVGNPPYMDSEGMTAKLPEIRKYCVGRYAAASGNWDMFCVFAERAIRLCKEGGYSSFIVPNKLGAAGYAGGIRRVLTVDNRLLSVRDYSHVPVFSVSVYPIVYVVRREKPEVRKNKVLYERMRITDEGIVECERTSKFNYEQYFSHPESPWEIFNGGGGDALRERLRGLPTLETAARVSGAATVAEAYSIQGLIREERSDDKGAIRLVNSGTIDRYDNLWGRKACRYLGGKYLRPVVPRSELVTLPHKRLKQAQTPKVIIAGMTKRLEAIVDLDGNLLAGKSTTIVTSSHDPRLILAVLNSKLSNYFYNTAYGGNRLAGGYLRIGPPQIKKIPIPSSDALASKRAQAIVKAVQQILELGGQVHDANTEHKKIRIGIQIDAIDRQIDQLIYELYDLTDEDIRTVESSLGSR